MAAKKKAKKSVECSPASCGYWSKGCKIPGTPKDGYCKEHAFPKK